MKPWATGRHGLNRWEDKGKTGEEAWEEEKAWAGGEGVTGDGASIQKMIL